MRSLRASLPVISVVLAACSPALAATAPIGQEPKSPPMPIEVVAALRSELIPAPDSPTGYGPRFNGDGYAELLDWNRLIVPATSWSDGYEAIDIMLPCCQAVHPNRDETLNCGCGHHQALYGAAKGLLARGYDLDRVQAEIDRWKGFFFPEERLLAELERRSLTDPVYREALGQFKTQGLC